MHFNRNRRRSLLSAKNFTIAMVLVNAAGFALVQQKMRGAQVDDAFALDDRAQPIAAIRPVELPERQVLPEIQFAAEEPSRPFVELPELEPLPNLAIGLDLADPMGGFESPPLRAESLGPARGAKAAGLAVARPAAGRDVESEPELKLTRIDRMPAPVSGKSAKAPLAQRPVLIEAVPGIPSPSGMELARMPSSQDSFTAAFGQSAEPQAEATATFGAPTSTASRSAGYPVDIEATAPSLQAPVVNVPPDSAITVPAPSATELPPLAPFAPSAEPPQPVAAAA